jgi:hypothetical protein
MTPPCGVPRRLTVRFPDRQQPQRHRRLDDPVFDRGDAQRPGFPVAFGDAYATHRAGPMHFVPQLFQQRIPPLCPRFVAAGAGRTFLPVHSRRAVVMRHGTHRGFHDVAPPCNCLMTAPGSLRRSGSGSAPGSLFRGSSDEVHCRCDRTVQTASCFRVRPRGLFPDAAFGRQQSNSTGGTLTRVACSFTGASPKS